MKRNKIIHLNGSNYSEMLSNLSDLFIKEFPDDFDTWDILDFSMEVWNMANLKRLVPENIFKKTDNLLEDLEGTDQLFEKMIDYKQKHYINFDKFILDYELDFEEEPPKLEVISGNLDDYMKVIEEEEDEYEDEDEDEEFQENFINRNAIILKPKKLFVNWVKMLDDESSEELIFETKIYLIDEDVFELEDWLRQKFDYLFVKELETWSFNEELWPQNRSLSMFKEWFGLDFSTMVYDMEYNKISKDIF